MKNCICYITFLALILVSCSSDEPTPAPVTPEDPEVEALHEELPFPMGAAVAINLLKNNAKYGAVVKKEFISITAENAMKFDALHPGKNTYFWTDADYLVNYATTNGKRIHGHTLNWHTQTPAWVTNFDGDTEAWENLLKDHIQTVVTHFKGKVKSWDVVNEAFNDDGTRRSTIWSQKLGNDYIERAFQYAHEADPEALLFYNDYGHEYSAAKRTAINNMISAMLDKDVPIHGIGLQFHMTHTQSNADIIAAVNAAASTGLLVHISELDVRVNDARVPNLTFNSTLATQQSNKYKAVVKAYMAVPVAQRFGITTWNVGDGDSWIPGWQGAPDFPLPFDTNYERKPAYYGIIEGAE